MTIRVDIPVDMSACEDRARQALKRRSRAQEALAVDVLALATEVRLLSTALELRDDDVAALQAENERLREQLADARASGAG